MVGPAAAHDEWVHRRVTTPTRAFVLGLADDDGLLDAGALYDAADAAGFTATTMRLALMRLRDAGALTVDGRGRNASIRLTERGRADRSPDLAWVAAAYRLDAGLDPWDHMWHLVSFEIPETQRAARDAVRARIVDL
ncbi:MAG: transcriptional regulator, partial [Actinomycetota bacterium]